jgi:senataxin
LEADCLNAFRFGCTKMMLVGDPNQLPPTVMSKAGRDYGLDISLYDRLYNSLIKSKSNPITMLNVQYRMHRDICEFPSFCFYNSTLITPPKVDKRSRNFPLQRLYFYNLVNSTETRDRDGSIRNEKEASVVKRLCDMLIDYLEQYNVTNNWSLNLQSEVSKSIAIITPYRDQIRCFQNLNLPLGIEVMTVDGMQGKEKEIIIYSCVRNNDEDIGFLKDKRRLNVALTRAREALYVVGNLKQFARQPKNEFWAKMVQYTQSNGRNIIEDIDYNSLKLPIINKT